MILLAVFECAQPRRNVAAQSWLVCAPGPAGGGFRRSLICGGSVLWLAAGLVYGGDWVFPCPTNEIARYTAHRVTEPMSIDGRLDEPAWQAAPTSPRFVDIITGEPARFDTRAMVLWDATNLYVAYRVEEPNVRATYTQPNDPIYYDNDIELFVAGPDAYYEFELNAFNTPYEVFFIWEEAYERGGFAQDEQFARSKLRPFNGVGFTTHPRGGRLGQFTWTFPGRKTAVHIDGTVNDGSDIDRGWTVEIALPWSGFRWLATDGRALPPGEGDVWRMDFSRFNIDRAHGPPRDSGGWVWTRHGVWDSHIPECFAFVRFTAQPLGSGWGETNRTAPVQKDLP